jgi:hypothetical protein
VNRRQFLAAVPAEIAVDERLHKPVGIEERIAHLRKAMTYAKGPGGIILQITPKTAEANTFCYKVFFNTRHAEEAAGGGYLVGESDIGVEDAFAKAEEKLSEYLKE